MGAAHYGAGVINYGVGAAHYGAGAAHYGVGVIHYGALNYRSRKERRGCPRSYASYASYSSRDLVCALSAA